MFQSKTFSVDLSKVTEPEARARLIVGQLRVAEKYLGERPTHVIADRSMRLDVEVLDVERLRVHRVPLAWGSSAVVRLAVAESKEAVLFRGPGGPRRTQATQGQVRLL
jgi:hypothetical protein